MANNIEELYGKNGSLRVKDLFERLPYGIFVLLPDTEEEAVVFTADYHPNWFKARAYLRPMDDMTDAEREEYDQTFIYFFGRGRVETKATYDWLNKNYFDYRGLIEIGEAIKAPKGMYVKSTEEVKGKKYDVDVTMVYNGIMRVEADSEDEALEKAQEMLDAKGLKNAPNEIEVPNGCFHFGEATADYATLTEE